MNGGDFLCYEVSLNGGEFLVGFSHENKRGIFAPLPTPYTISFQNFNGFEKNWAIFHFHF